MTHCYHSLYLVWATWWSYRVSFTLVKRRSPSVVSTNCDLYVIISFFYEPQKIPLKLVYEIKKKFKPYASKQDLQRVRDETLFLKCWTARGIREELWKGGRIFSRPLGCFSFFKLLYMARLFSRPLSKLWRSAQCHP